MNINIKQNIKQELRLSQVLTPKMIQMFKTFQQSYDALNQSIEKVAQDNIFLDVIRFDELLPHSSHRKMSSKESYVGHSDSMIDTNADSKKSLKEELYTQLTLERLGEKDQAIAKALIDEIDERGYIMNYPEVRDVITKQLNVKDRKVHDILKIIQTFEPDGVGSRSLKECLLIQVKEYNFESEALRDILHKVIQHHLEELGDQQYEKICSSLGIEEDGLRHLAEFIRENLRHNPAAEYSSDSFNQHIVPSFQVEYGEAGLKLNNLERKKGIKVGIIEKYETILNDKNLDDDTKAYMKEQYQKAKELVENIEKRQQSLDDLAMYIVKQQTAFIEKGELFLEPLLQKDVAQVIGISPSTVSRILSSKYIQTPHGTYSLKQLCPRDHFGKTAERIKLMVIMFIQKYPHYSDRKIAFMLKLEGINIARRTVTKYRLSAGVDSKFKRNLDEVEHLDDATVLLGSEDLQEL